MTDTVSSSTSAVASTATSSSSSSSTSAISDAALADYDDFLTLLTTQLNNQDPLNPQDSTEFVEQIATFTTVEQQINANERLDQLIEATLAANVSDLASWVGMEVSAPGLAYTFDGESLSIDPPTDDTAETAQMLVKDSDETVVATIDYDPSDASSIVWDGSLDDGTDAEAGSYFIDFEMSYVDADTGETTTENYTSADFSKVVEARIIDDEPALILENGFIIQADLVNAVRDPSSTVEDVVEDVVEAATS